MRIVIDLQASQGESRFRGIGRYSMSLAKAMATEGKRRSHDMHVVLSGLFPDTVPDIRKAFSGLLPQDRIHVMSLPAASKQNPWLDRAAKLLREDFLASLEPDVVHLTSLFDGWIDDCVTSVGLLPHQIPTAVTLYDLIPLAMSDVYLVDVGYRAFYHEKLDHLKRFDLLLAISAYSRSEAIDLLDVPPEKVVNISAAVDPLFLRKDDARSDAKSLSAKFNISRPYLMYVPGGFDHRKNFSRLIQAFAQLPDPVRRKHQLVIGSKLPVGLADEIAGLSATFGLEPDDIVLTDYLSDDDLKGLYTHCRLCVFPSLSEGFGLPVLEAMACGAPVIGSNTTSLPEVVGRPDATFDPYSVDSISATIERVLTDEKFEAELKAHALVQAQEFSWERCARLALDAIEEKFKRPRAKVRSQVEKGDVDIAADIDAYFKSCQLDVRPSPSDLATLEFCTAANRTATSEKAQLLIDISELVHRDVKTGIQRVVRSILLELVQNPPDGMRVEAVYSIKGHGLRYARQFMKRFLGLAEDGAYDDPVTFRRNDIFLGLDLGADLFPAMSQTLSHLRESGVHIYYVVYDLTPLMDVKWHTAGMTDAFMRWIDGLGTHSHGLICISRAVSNDVRKWFKVNPPALGKNIKIRHFHLGADIDSSVPTKGIPASGAGIFESMSKRPSVLMVGTIEPRKGYTQTLNAFELLWKSEVDVNLVIVGKSGWNMEELTSRLAGHEEQGRRLFWLSGVSDEYLEKIYRTASVLLAASEAEGFGLPLIEAAQHRLPILARGLPVFKEVAGAHASYFNGSKPQDIANAIRRWLKNSSEGTLPDQSSMTWNTWKDSAAQLTKIIIQQKRQRHR